MRFEHTPLFWKVVNLSLIYTQKLQKHHNDRTTTVQRPHNDTTKLLQPYYNHTTTILQSYYIQKHPEISRNIQIYLEIFENVKILQPYYNCITAVKIITSTETLSSFFKTKDKNSALGCQGY
jgi:hypothetical protein